MNRFLLGLVLFLSLLSSCGNQQEREKAEPTDLSKQEFTGISLDERFRGTDSIIVVFYKDPYGADSLRYTRYYTQVSMVEATAIEVLLNNLSDRFYYEPQRRNCRGEGKIWCFTKGKVFQTLYFSAADAECNYLYLLNNGNFYYAKLSGSLEEKLKAWKERSTEPPNEGRDPGL